MLARDIITLDYFHHLPESCFVREHLDAAMKALADDKPNKRIKLKNFWWTGTRSATSYEDVFLKIVAPKVLGKVEVIFTWEGGEWQTGLRIEDGKVTEFDVAKTLVPRK